MSPCASDEPAHPEAEGVDAAERILGLTADEMTAGALVDRDWRTIHEDGSAFDPAHHPAIATLRTGLQQRDVVVGILKSNGSCAWVSVTATPECQLASGSHLCPDAVASLLELHESGVLASLEEQH